MSTDSSSMRFILLLFNRLLIILNIIVVPHDHQLFVYFEVHLPIIDISLQYGPITDRLARRCYLAFRRLILAFTHFLEALTHATVAFFQEIDASTAHLLPWVEEQPDPPQAPNPPNQNPAVWE